MYNRYLYNRYKLNNGRDLSCKCIAKLLQNTLYNRRLFPFYAFNVLAGIDENGKGEVYSYDAVGTIEKNDYICLGSSETLIQPILDNVVGKENRVDLQNENKKITKEEAALIMKEAFLSAGEVFFIIYILERY